MRVAFQMVAGVKQISLHSVGEPHLIYWEAEKNIQLKNFELVNAVPIL